MVNWNKYKPIVFIVGWVLVAVFLFIIFDDYVKLINPRPLPGNNMLDVIRL